MLLSLHECAFDALTLFFSAFAFYYEDSNLAASPHHTHTHNQEKNKEGYAQNDHFSELLSQSPVY